jgi:hypothetical protein
MLKRIAVKDIQLGMFICEFCGSWMEHPFWKTKFLLTDEKDLQAIQASGIKELWIDVTQGADLDKAVPGKTEEEVAQETEAVLLEAENTQGREKISLEDEIQTAAKLCAKAKEAVIEMFSDARMGKAIQIEQAKALVEEISNSVMRQPHALISLARLKTADEYTYMHSVAVCALMIALARQLNLEEEMVREAGFAGLLHDIGKVGIPMKVLNKPGKLTDSEFAIVKSHPEALWCWTSAYITMKKWTAPATHTDSRARPSASMPKWVRSAMSMMQLHPIGLTKKVGHPPIQFAKWPSGARGILMKLYSRLSSKP